MMLRGVEAAGGALRTIVERGDRGALRTVRLPVDRVLGAGLLKRGVRIDVERDAGRLDWGARVDGTSELKAPRGTAARTVRGVGRLVVEMLRVETVARVDGLRVLRIVGVVARVAVVALERVDVVRRGVTVRDEGAVPVVRATDERVVLIPDATGRAFRASALVKLAVRAESPRLVSSRRVETFVRSAWRSAVETRVRAVDERVAERSDAVRFLEFGLVRTRVAAERLPAGALRNWAREVFSSRATRALAERAEPAIWLGPRMTRVGV